MAEENYDSEKFQEFLDKQQYRTADIFTMAWWPQTEARIDSDFGGLPEFEWDF